METEEIFRVSVEQAKRSVARHGFTFMSVIGSDPRILEIYSQKPKFKRLRRKSPTTKSLIEPLTASQFINSHKFQKNSLNKAPTSRYLPTSKGSISRCSHFYSWSRWRFWRVSDTEQWYISSITRHCPCWYRCWTFNYNGKWVKTICSRWVFSTWNWSLVT